MNGLYDAKIDRIPLLAIVAQVHISHEHGFLQLLMKANV